MNNLSGEKSLTLPSYYEQQLDEIIKKIGISEEKDVFLSNLDSAYKKVGEELFGECTKIELELNDKSSLFR